jgi:cyclase
MVAKRIIPCLDVADGRVVKGVNFVGLRDAGDPVELACLYSASGADELVFLDIAASHQGRATLVDLVRRTAEAVTIPFTVGGGISSVEGITELLRAGADKISLNSAAVRDPQLVSRGAERFGCQCIVVAIDARRRLSPGIDRLAHDAKAADGNGPDAKGIDQKGAEAKGAGWDVYVKGGRENTGLDAVAWAQQVVALGAGEILLTSMDGDGTQAGYDLALTRAVAEAVDVPVIASGGAGCIDHIAEALAPGPEGGSASAALLASLLHDRVLTVEQIKTDLLGRGLNLRPLEIMKKSQPL